MRRRIEGGLMRRACLVAVAAAAILAGAAPAGVVPFALAPGNLVTHAYLFRGNVRYDRGGSGYLRLVEFQPDGRAVQIRTYLPLLDRPLNDPANEFSFSLQSARTAPETRP